MPRAPAPGERRAANGGAERRDALLRSDRKQLPWVGGQGGGVEAMHRARAGLDQVAPELREPRSLAWVAIGLVDGVLDAPQPEWQASAKVLCNKLDFHMRDLAAGSQAVNDPL